MKKLKLLTDNLMTSIRKFFNIRSFYLCGKSGVGEIKWVKGPFRMVRIENNLNQETNTP